VNMMTPNETLTAAAKVAGLTEQQVQRVVVDSLRMRANWIETGDVVLSAVDVTQRGGKPRQLLNAQTEFVDQLRAMAEQFAP